MTLATCVLLDPSATAKVLKLKYPRRGFLSCRPNLRTRKSSNTTSTITRPRTGSSIAEQFAMAGNEIDLLKQATQAMMARYEGEYLFPFILGHSTRYIQLFVRNFFGKMLYAMDIWADLALQDCAGVFLSLSSLAMMSLAHVSTSKLTRRGPFRLQSGSAYRSRNR